MISDSAALEKQAVKVSHRKQCPSQYSVREYAPGSPGEPELDELQNKNQHRRRRTSPPAFSGDLQISRQFLQSIQTESMKVSRIFVERMTKWRDDMYVAARGQYALNFPHDIVWTLYVLKDSVALNTLELIAGKREMVGICHNVHARHWKQVGR